MKCGLVLGGGGAKGAYHVGVVKALIESGYEFDGFVGTSIGAINAAMLAQGDFYKALELWTKISPEHIFTKEDQPIMQLADLKALELNTDFIDKLKEVLSRVIDGKGVSTEKMADFLNVYIDEDKIRASGKDFGLVTFSRSERKPYELMLEDIPQGKLVDYIMASASFPGFSAVTIDGNKYLDGGFYDNCPVDLLNKLGYDEIIAIRIGFFPGIMPSKLEKMKNVKLIDLKEGTGLSTIMLFTPEAVAANIELGYYDGLRFAGNLWGKYYYIRPTCESLVTAKLAMLDKNVISEMGAIINGGDGKNILFEKIIPRLATHLKLGKNFSCAEFVIALLEKKAKEKNIERFHIYEYEQLCTLVKKTEESVKPDRGLILTPWFIKNEEIADILTQNIL